MQVSGHVRKRESKDNILRYQIIIELPRDNKTGKRKRIYKTVDGNKKYAEKIMRNGMPFRPDTFSNRYIRFLNRKGLKHIRFHDLRHTSCTLLLSEGISMKTLQKRLGHSDYRTTADIYSHVLSSDEMIASCIADDIVFSKMG